MAFSKVFPQLDEQQQQQQQFAAARMLLDVEHSSHIFA